MAVEGIDQVLGAFRWAPALARPPNGPPLRVLSRRAEQTRQRHVECPSGSHNGPERGIQGGVFELLQMLQVDPDGVGGLLLRPAMRPAETHEKRTPRK